MCVRGFTASANNICSGRGIAFAEHLKRITWYGYDESASIMP